MTGSILDFFLFLLAENLKIMLRKKKFYKSQSKSIKWGFRADGESAVSGAHRIIAYWCAKVKTQNFFLVLLFLIFWAETIFGSIYKGGQTIFGSIYKGGQKAFLDEVHFEVDNVCLPIDQLRFEIVGFQEPLCIWSIRFHININSSQFVPVNITHTPLDKFGSFVSPR